MEKQEAKQFRLFEEEILKYNNLDIFTINALLNRYITPLKKRKFFKPEYKIKYYSYWIKILVKKEVLIPCGFGYKIGRNKNRTM